MLRNNDFRFSNISMIDYLLLCCLSIQPINNKDNLNAELINFNEKVNNFIEMTNITNKTSNKTSNKTIDDKIIEPNNSLNMAAAFDEFENKKVPVLMFHNFDEKENRYTISPNNFKKLLTNLHSNDFYSVSLDEFYKGDFSKVPVGKKPVLLTFDDAGLGQFMLDSLGSICNNSAVGILEDFYKNNDFGKGGVFFISYGIKNDFRLPFMQDELASKKMKMLVNLGYDVAHHTINHPDNTRASTNNIFEQHTISDALFQYLLEDDYNKIKVKSYAHPFGASPKNSEVFNFLSNNYDVVFDAWGGQSNHPLSNNFNPQRVPRIETTYHELSAIINNNDTYKVTKDTKNYYNYAFNSKRPDPLKKIKSLSVEVLEGVDKSYWPFTFY